MPTWLTGCWSRRGSHGRRATGAAVVRRRRAHRHYDSDELRERLHRRLAEVSGHVGGGQAHRAAIEAPLPTRRAGSHRGGHRQGAEEEAAIGSTRSAPARAGSADSRRITAATDSTMAAAPTTTVTVTSSERTRAPSTTAMTGFT